MNAPLKLSLYAARPATRIAAAESAIHRASRNPAAVCREFHVPRRASRIV